MPERERRTNGTKKAKRNDWLTHQFQGPQWHPTDVGHIKLASHLMQFIKIKFGWDLLATGPEVQHETLYWNDQANY